MAKILVIDDDRMMRQLYREILTRAGHQVVSAESATEGLARIDRHPDLIVVDLMMPDVDGYEFVNRLRVKPGHVATPVIVVSGAYTGEWALRLGADRFLLKPFSAGELVALVDAMLRPAASRPAPRVRQALRQ